MSPMEETSRTITVLGVDIVFRQGVDLTRVRMAADLLEKLFSAEKNKRSAAGGEKDMVILTFIALGLADDLLQTKSKLEDFQNGMSLLLHKIDTSEKNSLGRM